MRIFGGGADAIPRKNRGTLFGYDMQGNAVTSAAAFNTAVAYLRTPAGHNPANNCGLARAPAATPAAPSPAPPRPEP